MNRYLIRIIIMLIIAFLPTFLNAQNLKYELAYKIDISKIKEPILQMDVDDFGFLYLITAKGLHFYDCSTPTDNIIDTINLNTQEKSQPLVNNSGEVFFSRLHGNKTRIFDEKGDVKFVLGGEEPSLPIKQILLDSRGFFILADNQKITYYDQNGRNDHTIKFDKTFKIICLDNKNNIFVLKKSTFSPEQREKIAWLNRRLQDSDDKIAQINIDINNIMIERATVNLDLEKIKKDEMELINQIKFSPFNRFEYKQERSYSRSGKIRRNNTNNQGNKNNRDSIKPSTQEYFNRNSLYDLRKQISQIEIDERKSQIKYQEKQLEKLKLQTEMDENLLEKKKVMQESGSMVGENDYEIQIYDTWGDMTFAFTVPQPKTALPLYNSYLTKIDSKNNFFAVISNQSSNSTILDANFDFKEIQRGAADTVNIYSANGDFVGKIESDPPFNGINNIAIDGNGNLYVLDTNFSQVKKFKVSENK